MILDELEAEEILDLKAVDLFGPVPAEGVEGFDDGEAGGLDAAGDGAVGAQVGFACDELGEVVEVGDGLFGGGGGERILDKVHLGKAPGILLDAYPGMALRLIVGGDILLQPDCLKPGEWQHVAATMDAVSGVRRIYLNGKLLKEERRDSEAAMVSWAHHLQRWVNACAGRGGAPIKFNGSIFNVECVVPIKSYCGICNFDADFREWGNPYWWQNTRLIYWAMPMAGDSEFMRAMLAYCDYSGDTAFRDQKLLPFAREILRFYEVHWPRDSQGKIHFFPLSSLEAIQNATNPMPDIAGLDFVLPQLIACNADETQKAAWQGRRP